VARWRLYLQPRSLFAAVYDGNGRWPNDRQELYEYNYHVIYIAGLLNNALPASLQDITDTCAFERYVFFGTFRSNAKNYFIIIHVAMTLNGLE